MDEARAALGRFSLERYWLSPRANEVVSRHEKPFGEGGLDYGPGHIVFADPNAEDHSIDWCLEWAKTEECLSSKSPELVSASIDCLVELRAIPEIERLNREEQIAELTEELESDPDDEETRAELAMWTALPETVYGEETSPIPYIGEVE